ncbi:hypothetical protein [Desulfosporosinus nitroreducens]|uniref:Uncharacterized protein n=1 Tax=Desulfosporosinus nitroreducens TaxID=2018668 RepID=A0ABT8QLP8_9FIRM|nr:hypothetical protein [Desulfosporosinus nitroreducens]MCO1600756.1 hypothetical protein [Desulfosporosinus nitroreducens]MDO0822277.1 hypothetical protein [Desulfosporosinus nitroreducens]
MGNPCGMTKAKIYEETEVYGIPVYYGAGVNPVNSPAQLFVAWGRGAISAGLIHTFNSESKDQGVWWFIDEDEAEAQYVKIQEILSDNK